MAPGAVWNGPLAVMINRGSASASEIFAAAIQDHRRGLVIGETSYGKGTVQTMIDLGQVAHAPNAKLGDLKLTIAQFFRVNGGTTQLRGVTPDIELPAISDKEHYGETSYGNGLPWMQIKPADFHPMSNIGKVLPELEQRHDRRVSSDRDYQNLLEDIAEFDKRRKKDAVSLNETERRQERDAQEAKMKLREKDGATAASTDGHAATEAVASAESDTDADSRQEQEKRDKKDRDVLLTEAASILGDNVALQGNQVAEASPVAKPSRKKKAAN